MGDGRWDSRGSKADAVLAVRSTCDSRSCAVTSSQADHVTGTKGRRGP